MEQENFQPIAEQNNSKDSFTKATPLSKYFAVALFIALPFIGGLVGYTYAPEKAIEIERVSNGSTQITLANNQVSEIVTPAKKEELYFIFCIPSLYEDDRERFRFWYDRITNLYPDYFYVKDGYARYVYPGSYCELSDGTMLVTFTPDPDGSYQAIALFDSKGNLLRKTNNLNQKTLGDIIPPKLDSIENGKVNFSFGSGDAGVRTKQEYELDLSTFVFDKLSDTSY